MISCRHSIFFICEKAYQTSLNTFKTIQTLSKLAGQGKPSSGGGMLDLVGSLMKHAGKESNPAGDDTVIEPLLDTAIELLGGDKNNGIKDIVKPIINNLIA